MYPLPKFRGLLHGLNGQCGLPGMNANLLFVLKSPHWLDHMPLILWFWQRVMHLIALPFNGCIFNALNVLVQYTF